ncbi:hypothetical protein DSCO28_50960 [Desulfosarcina ovata subsp. sediminis]|uniref:Enolase N-terminal domain-containing protein n=1 Tax=Desulfosarcina ovata subsp. sediminis TaxID=885957 RepID=A0A5K7ZWP3_9BACT|nr:hypothetical protein DSCO28_50960 [Desulfosarcina ovata subsp. sediminis]
MLITQVTIIDGSRKKGQYVRNAIAIEITDDGVQGNPATKIPLLRGGRAALTN